VQYLCVIDGIHHTIYDTFYFLVRLHDAYFKLPLVGLGKSMSYPKLLLRLRIIELTCQYLELVASYSIACGETGLLFPQRVLSVDSGEIKKFWAHVENISDDVIRTIFNPNHALTAPEILDIKERYGRIAAFRSRYWSLYNAIKHGMRVYLGPVELAPKAEARQPGEWYMPIHWVNVSQAKRNRIKSMVKKWDGKEREMSIQKQNTLVDLFPVDDLSEYKIVVDDCCHIINRVIENNTPPWLRSETQQILREEMP